MPREISSSQKLETQPQPISEHALWFQSLNSPQGEHLQPQRSQVTPLANEQLQAQNILPNFQLSDSQLPATEPSIISARSDNSPKKPQTDTRIHLHTVHQREHRQQERILEGLHSGQLTRKEFNELEKEEKSISETEKKMRAHNLDGQLTTMNREKLHKLLDSASADIFKQKHDEQKAPPEHERAIGSQQARQSELPHQGSRTAESQTPTVPTPEPKQPIESPSVPVSPPGPAEPVGTVGTVGTVEPVEPIKSVGPVEPAGPVGPVEPPPPGFQQEKAKSASSFTESVGFDAHLSYTNTNYNDYAKVEQFLKESGVKEIRTQTTLSDSRTIDEMIKLNKDLGVKFDVIMDPRWISAKDAITLAHKLGPAINRIEAPNEYDISHPKSDKDWVTTLRNYMRDLKKDNDTGLPILSPSLVKADSAEKFAAPDGINYNPKEYFDVVNLHPYQYKSAPDDPSTVDSLVNWKQKMKALDPTGELPIVTTEIGKGTQDASTGGVSQKVQAEYTLRELLYGFNNGISSTDIYQLMDNFKNGDNGRENSLGLVDKDENPKQAFTALSNLMSMLHDDGDGTGGIAPAALNFKLSGGGSDIQQTLVQKSDGSFYLALWRAVPGSNTGSENVTLTVPDERTLSLYNPLRSAAALEEKKGNSIQVSVTGEPVLIRIA